MSDLIYIFTRVDDNMCNDLSHIGLPGISSQLLRPITNFTPDVGTQSNVECQLSPQVAPASSIGLSSMSDQCTYIYSMYNWTITRNCSVRAGRIPLLQRK